MTPMCHSLHRKYSREKLRGGFPTGVFPPSSRSWSIPSQSLARATSGLLQLTLRRQKVQCPQHPALAKRAAEASLRPLHWKAQFCVSYFQITWRKEKNPKPVHEDFAAAFHRSVLKRADLGNHSSTVKSVPRRCESEFSGRDFPVPHGEAGGSRASSPLDRHGVGGEG